MVERVVNLHQDLLAAAGNVFKMSHKFPEVAGRQSKQEPIARQFGQNIHTLYKIADMHWFHAIMRSLHCGISILPLSASGHSRHSRYPCVSGSPQERTFGQCRVYECAP